ncbi:MAG: HAD family hydrolase [Gaiellaceae bacterium]
MARVTAVVFDVGETLVDEARWREAGDTTRAFAVEHLHPDALACLADLRRRGLRVGAAGNMRAMHEDFLRELVDFVGSSQSWGVEKPAPAFFARVVAEAGRGAEEIAYVGDRVDNDVEPALAAGLAAVHIRRGAWAHQEPPDAAIRIASLDELPAVLP